MMMMTMDVKIKYYNNINNNNNNNNNNNTPLLLNFRMIFHFYFIITSACGAYICLKSVYVSPIETGTSQ
jgi:hypothetical protein